MSTHDVLAYAVATEAVRRLRAGIPPWNAIFSTDAYVTSSRVWPVPDFVLVDDKNALSIGVEFKPPHQTKREYLTGLGQAVAYSSDFHYGLLVLPQVANDGYPIADHVREVLQEPALGQLPVGLLVYNPSLLSPANPSFDELHFFASRVASPTHPASLDTSFYAKWREMSPDEMYRLLAHSYDEMRAPSSSSGTVRDRAFDSLWSEIQKGTVTHWAGAVRHYADSTKNKVAVSKNYRNFLFHVGWTESGGSLTKEGLDAMHVGSLYGALSGPFRDVLAIAVLVAGKHLILFNAISEYQDSLKAVPDEGTWLSGLETFLEEKGLLKRNPARAAAAVAGSARQFLKAEKQLWKQLGLVLPRGSAGSRVFHAGRGFIFNWSRITSLLQGSTP